ncbi:universal stress protein [Erythrobacter sp. MTPC3]|uniref:universal stress protein n=1 Tax=Erythrobacter sp. MTPC3 TaxID=3056564 RepID=UPI0036F3D6C3
MSWDVIVVATDFSSRGDRAIDRGKQLSERTGAKLRFVHATNLPEDDSPDIAELNRKMREATGADPLSEAVEFEFVSGSPPKAIANACMVDDVSMLVIGPARYNSIGDYLLGTAVDYVLRNTEKPVLVTKNRAHGPYSHIVAGTDFSEGSEFAILTAARMFPDAEMHLIHGWHVPFQAFQKDQYVADEIESAERSNMEEFISALAVKEPRLGGVTFDLVKGGPTVAMRRGLETVPDALAVIGSHGASGFEQATIGSVTSDLLRCIEADTLVVNTKGAVA